MPRRIAIICVILIIIFGVFKNHISLFFSVLIDLILPYFNLQRAKIEDGLLFLTHDNEMNHGIGVLFYFFIYLILHAVLVHFLFYETPKVKKTIMKVLFAFVIGLGLLSILFKSLDFDTLGYITYDLFHQSVGRPLILFLIEGGGFIYKEIVEDT